MELVKLMMLFKNGVTGNGFIKKCLVGKKDGFGLNELLGIAAAIIIAAFIVIPSMRTFAQNMMTGLGNWWNNVIANRIFPTT